MLIDPYELAKHLGLQQTQRLRKTATRCGVQLCKVSYKVWAFITEEEAERIIWDTYANRESLRVRRRALTGQWARTGR